MWDIVCKFKSDVLFIIFTKMENFKAEIIVLFISIENYRLLSHQTWENGLVKQTKIYQQSTNILETLPVL